MGIIRPGLGSKSYEERLEELKIFSLYKPRLRDDSKIEKITSI